MATDDMAPMSDLDGFRPVIPANRYYLNHMLKHVERCIDSIDDWTASLRSRWVPGTAVDNGDVVWPEFDLPRLWLPAAVQAFLPADEARSEEGVPVTHEAITQMSQKAKGQFETLDSVDGKCEFLNESQEHLELAVRYYVRPYERLRLEIWTRLQQIDFVEYHEEAKVPTDLVRLPHALSIEQMIEQWFSVSPETQIDSFDISGPLDLKVNLVLRTVERKEFATRVDFGSTQAAWLPFIIAFFAGRNGADAKTAEKLYDSASKKSSNDSSKRKRARDKAISSSNDKLSQLDVRITNWGLKSGARLG